MADTSVTTETATPPADLPRNPAIAAQTIPQAPRKPADLPPVTTGTSEQYIHGLAAAVSRASTAHPLFFLFENETLPPGQSVADLDLRAAQRLGYESSAARLRSKLAASAGAFVAEAAGFAAVACWEPLRADEPPRKDPAVLAARPAYARFVEGVQRMMREHAFPVARRVSDGRFWKLSLMARDPEREYVPGAVRAVIVPFIERFTSDQNEGGAMPVWLEAAGERARDIYVHYGFRAVDKIDTDGVTTWGMMYMGGIDLEHEDKETAS